MNQQDYPERHDKQKGPLTALALNEQGLTIPLKDRYQVDSAQTKDTRSISNPTSDSPPPIYQFSVLVALEWQPSEHERQELVDAFLQASEFLYNVTDNCMAIGQVVFGGKDLMDCADIQIMASNRFNPRSWVDALNDKAKYTPIRAGRGIWNRNDRRTELWKDMASVRTLIHEWAHYALGLPDQYLEARPVALDISTQQKTTPDRQTATSAYLLVDKPCSVAISDTFVIVPKIPVSNGGIMETVTGKEFVASEDEPDKDKHYKEIWDKIRARYQKVQPNGTTDYELRSLPALPNIFFAERRQGEPLSLEQWDDSRLPSNQYRELWLDVPDDISAEHSWIYVVKGNLDGQPIKIDQVIAQGTFDAPSRTIGFKLLNAQIHNWLVIVGKNKKGGDIVLQGRIDDIKPRPLNGRDRAIVTWQDATPDPFPVIDVIPLPCDRNKAITDIQVRIRSATKPTAWISPLGSTPDELDFTNEPPESDQWISQACSPTSLDGHVLMRWDGNKTVICTYSQGGGPATHVAARYSPITAGSSEGNAMIFFADRVESQQYAHVRVVTTLIHSSFGIEEGGIEPRSYVFSVASNDALPEAYNPTLVLYFDAHAPKKNGDLIIHRLENERWQPMPTYVADDDGRSFAALPLNQTTAENLFAQDNRPRAERYRLFWMPHETPASSQAL